MPSNIVLRPITAQDASFLYRVFVTTRPDVTSLAWDETQKAAFLKMQFDAQHHHYQTYFPAAQYSVIEKAGEPVGRLYVDRRVDKIHIIDITLLPEYRGTGLGGELLQELIDEGTAERKNVSLYVERENIARNLYKRLGFEPREEQGIYQLMEWEQPFK
jgi:ribosomal protein S18 acetylase RimI-like enzyme